MRGTGGVRGGVPANQGQELADEGYGIHQICHFDSNSTFKVDEPQMC